jgi:hypothetical protein
MDRKTHRWEIQLNLELYYWREVVPHFKKILPNRVFEIWPPAFRLLQPTTTPTYLIFRLILALVSLAPENHKVNKVRKMIENMHTREVGPCWKKILANGVFEIWPPAFRLLQPTTTPTYLIFRLILALVSLAPENHKVNKVRNGTWPVQILTHVLILKK